jgi:hypothetical protein
LRDRPGARVLEIGSGSGRNTRALHNAGFVVRSLDEHPHALCAAALSTHALLHGTPHSVATTLDRIADRLESRAPLFATFGSVRDARYGEGTRVEEFVYAPLLGDERGIAHVFFDERRLHALLCDRWEIELLEERNVDGIAGSWAHTGRPLQDAVHWFAIVGRA